MYKVETDIPMPCDEAKRGQPKYPFGDMEVGDSFEFQPGVRDKIRAASKMYGYRNGMRFMLYGRRIWRTE